MTGSIKGPTVVEYMWVRVGDGDPEPAAITGEKGSRKATTLGCPDPFDVDDPESGCAILLTAHANYDPTKAKSRNNCLYGRALEARIVNPLEKRFGGVPFEEVNAENAARREIAYQREIKRQPHGYAGFGRRARP